MENVVLVIHLIVSLCVIGIVLMQRSEGGGLGIGGGGGAMSGRSAATALGKLTWILAVAFIATSITMTIFAARNSADTSVIDRLGIEQPVAPTPSLPTGGELLPPVRNDTPLLPPRND